MSLHSLTNSQRELIDAHIAWLEVELEQRLGTADFRHWSEHELLIALRKAHPDMEWLQAREGLALFRLHFLLFHCLYRLRDRWRQEQSGDLLISALDIHRRPWSPGRTGLAESDPLADYYRDLDQLTAMDEDGLQRLLEGFWSGMVDPACRGQALKVLGLKDPVDDIDIRKRYRQLAMKHHPDRGGEPGSLQTIHRAMQQLGLR